MRRGDDDQAETVDRGRFPDARTPWDEPDRRAEALDWATGRLAAHGLRESGRRQVRLRPWSVLVRFSVDGGRGDRPVWFKAVPPAAAFEAGLAASLADWVPDHVLAPLAVDAERGWCLMPDGGPLLRQVLDEGAGTLADWEDALRSYAVMQRALVPYAEKVTGLGVPSARPLELPGLFDTLLAENQALTSQERAALEALRPRLVEWCAELATVGVADSLDHADLHDGQLFRPAPGRFTFFDWGDALVGHPFSSLLVPARSAEDRFGPRVLPRLRDAYLEPWTGDGIAAGDLRRAVSLAWRLAALGRAASWGRMFPVPGAPAAPGGAETAHWLRELHCEPPL
ncbi:phosphotransferase [Streptomyces sp. ME02-6991-2A]|uniref:phosphotransferase n=1 Tax=Streptomyces sp. ME02-6991-2A TaxID=3028677 RepID=UPI0029ADA102|nr:phosphotransferase [Streptomyces sp. ME02-6991-2A]MDX3374731.1 phosphotransferase [Streptomyces sp. ME02-6991-2A]